MEAVRARFYLCSPSMFGYGVRARDLIIGTYTLGAVITWAGLLAHSDIHVFSQARFDKP